MVDWGLAHQVARFAAGTDAAAPPHGPELATLAEEMGEHVADHTGLAVEGPVPAPESLGRAEWAALNLDALSELLDPVAVRLDERLGFAGPLAGAMRAASGATLAAEAGLVLGYLSQRVLGQYELSLLEPERPARLVFVTANLDKAVRELRVDRQSFLGWVVIHELTHVFQFEGVRWLRGHMGGLLREYLDSVEVRVTSGAAGGLPSLPDIARLVESFREGGLVALVQSRHQRRLLDRIQAAMAVIEGYSEHVMDALGERLLPAYAGLREAMDRRRQSRSAPERVLERLLGLDLKLRQYRQGRAFCSEIAGCGGMDALNRVWDSPAALPSADELGRPGEWLERTSRGEPAPA